jgi:hypothetical protein
MKALALAVKLGDLAADYAEREEPLKTEKEARRLVDEHPEAGVSVKQVAEVLKQEQAAAEGNKERPVP